MGLKAKAMTGQNGQGLDPGIVGPIKISEGAPGAIFHWIQHRALIVS